MKAKTLCGSMLALLGCLVHAVAGTIDLNGSPRTLTLTDDFSSATTYTNTGDEVVDLTIEVDEGERISADAVFAGNIRLVKSGKGRLTLNAMNSYAGGTLWSAGYLEANNPQAFGAAKTTVTCQTKSTGIHNGDLWFYLLAAGDYDYTFDFQNSNIILWSIAGGVNVLGNVVDSTGAATGEVWLLGADKASKTLAGWNRPMAPLGIGVENLSFNGSVTAKTLDATTCYRRSDWRDVPGTIDKKDYSSYEDWKSGAVNGTRATPGVVTFNGALNTFESFDKVTYAGFAVSKSNCLSENMFFSWDKAAYGIGGSVDLGGTDQTINYLSGAETTDADSKNFRVIKSTKPARLTLKATTGANTYARLDGAVSVIYDAQDAGFTQSFIGARSHQTSGKLTARNGTLELGGETTWVNLTGLAALNCATVSVSTTAAQPFDAAKLTVSIERGGVIRTDRALTVRCAMVDGLIADVGTYSAANCDWVAGDGSIEVSSSEWAITSADFEEYAAKTITVPEGKCLIIDISSGEDATFAGKISGGGGVKVTGAGTLTLAGGNSFSGGLVFDGTGRLYAGSDAAFGATSGAVTVTQPGSSLGFKDSAGECRNPIDFTAKTGTSYLRFELATESKVFDVYGKITTSAPTTYIMRDTLGSCDDGECVVNFRGDIDAGTHVFGKSQQRYDLDAFMTMNFYGKISCGAFVQNPGAWGRGYYHFFAVNEIGELSPAIITFHAHADDCWKDAILSANYQQGGSAYHGASTLDFHGHSMTVAGFKSYATSFTGTTQADKQEALVSSGQPATVTVTGEGVYETQTGDKNDGKTLARLGSGISLVWSPVLTGEFAGKGILYNGTHQTEGTIVVERGTLATGGATKFANLSGITVRSGATFELDTTVANALPNLKTLVVESGAVFKVTQGTTPFTDGNLVLCVSSDSIVELPDGTSFITALVFEDGVQQKAASITSATWLRGNNVNIGIANARNVFVQPTGKWSAAASWSVGVPSETLEANVVSFNSPVSATIDSDAGFVREILVETQNGEAASELLVSNDVGIVAGRKLEVGRLGTVEVGNGGVVSLSDGAQIDVCDEGRFVMEDGLLSIVNSTWSGIPLQIHYGSVVDFAGTSRVKVDSEDARAWLRVGGVVTFTGNSSLEGRLAGFSIRPPNNESAGEIDITEHAAWFSGVTASDAIGFINLSTLAGQVLRMNYMSDATSCLSRCLRVGEGQSGIGELTVSAGCVKSFGSGVFIADAYEQQGNLCAPTGIVKLTAGKIEVETTASFGGLIVGSGYCASTDVSGNLLDNRFNGRMEISGGACELTGAYSMLVVGVGQTEAELNQSGGTLSVERSDRGGATIVGMAGANGRWTLSGGEVDLGGCLYIGGMTTNELGRQISVAKKTGELRRYPAELGPTGVGELVVSGGVMSVAKDLVLSADGRGSLVLTGDAKLRVAGNLDARTGSKLTVDVRGYEGGSRNLATFDGTTTPFTDENVTFLKDDGTEYKLVIDAKRIRIKRESGVLLIVR